MGENNIPALVANLVKSAMGGNLQAKLQINQIMQAAQQGDLEAQQLAQLIQLILEQMQGGGEAQAMRNGGKVGKFEGGDLFRRTGSVTLIGKNKFGSIPTIVSSDTTWAFDPSMRAYIPAVIQTARDAHWHLGDKSRPRSFNREVSYYDANGNETDYDLWIRTYDERNYPYTSDLTPEEIAEQQRQGLATRSDYAPATYIDTTDKSFGNKLRMGARKIGHALGFMEKGGRVGKLEDGGLPGKRVYYFRGDPRYDSYTGRVLQSSGATYDLGNGFFQDNDTINTFTPTGAVDYRWVAKHNYFIDNDSDMRYDLLDDYKTETPEGGIISIKSIIPKESNYKQGGKAKRKCPCMLKRQGGRLIEVDSCTGERVFRHGGKIK